MGNIYRFPGGEGARHETFEEINWEGEDEDRSIPLVVRIILNIIGGCSPLSSALPSCSCSS